jgi:excisionase family DNA binding protein
MSDPNFRVPVQLLLPWHPKHSVSVAMVAEMLDCSDDTVVRMIQSGELSAYQLRRGSPYRVYYESVLQHLDRIHTDAGITPRYRR